MENDPNNVKLAVLEEKVFNMVEVISKLDDTIDRLSDLSLNVSKMLAVHEEKLEFARESAAETAMEISKLEKDIDNRMAENSKRLRVVERRVWMAMGFVFSLTILLQTEIVTGAFQPHEESAIIKSKQM